ncbi:MBL fold metallo-hydrolase [Babesia caballi]|uniref:MBL fold metallo-hydrolase n=1 Tax=Babesia caballi TaxID=5871 RepID=A0AAV4LZD3_BABCB|nr:MBL fold metallo-hydrolase [Babesia caballi]
MAAAKAINAVGEEGLEGGDVTVGMTAGCLIPGFIVFTIGSISGAIMPATRLTVALQPRADMGLERPASILIHLTPICTMLPTALVHIVRAHGIQKEKLELEGIGVVGNRAEEGVA